MIYIVHFEKKLSHAQHYIGWTDNGVEHRFKMHLSGMGARILQVCNERRIEYKIVRLLPGDRQIERKLKNRKKTSELCPVCRGEVSYEEIKLHKLIEEMEQIKVLLKKAFLNGRIVAQEHFEGNFNANAAPEEKAQQQAYLAGMEAFRREMRGEPHQSPDDYLRELGV